MFVNQDGYYDELGKPPKWLRKTIGPILAAGTAFIPGVGPFLAPVVLAADMELQAQEAKKEAKKQQKKEMAAIQAQIAAQQAQMRQPTGQEGQMWAPWMTPVAAIAALLLMGN
jgi:hypothetical protein